MSTYQEALSIHAAEAKRILRPIVTFILILWFIELVDRLIFGGSLDQLGIIPRQMVGLRGVLFAPFLHGSFSHLLANTLPLLVLAFLISARHNSHILPVSAMILLISGLGTWLIAPANTVHIGVSGLIFGYFSFLVVNAWYERSAAAVILAALVIMVYGGLIWGILPAGGVSWQGHFFGLIGGATAAFYYSPRRA